jgi:hypothetical protein
LSRKSRLKSSDSAVLNEGDEAVEIIFLGVHFIRNLGEMFLQTHFRKLAGVLHERNRER